MRNNLVAIGIGLNMFFQEYFDVSRPELHIGKSWSWMLKEKVRFQTWIKQRIEDGTIGQYTRS